MNIVLGIIIALLAIGGVLVIVSTLKRQGKWGINLKPVFCPKCTTRAPRVRTPTSTQEALWGGSTCTTCGCKMDKWGKEIQ
ncbi:hypothetical protein GF342_01175 [Candidatus Woesearchaeota archaeon]|nr:hypothetical protein [Candidatus Woesearchaeota archaeon]